MRLSTRSRPIRTGFLILGAIPHQRVFEGESRIRDFVPMACTWRAFFVFFITRLFCIFRSSFLSVLYNGFCGTPRLRRWTPWQQAIRRTAEVAFLGFLVVGQPHYSSPVALASLGLLDKHSSVARHPCTRIVAVVSRSEFGHIVACTSSVCLPGSMRLALSCWCRCLSERSYALEAEISVVAPWFSISLP